MTSTKRMDQVCPVCERPLSAMEYEYIASQTPGMMVFPLENKRRILQDATTFVRSKGPGLIPVLIGGVGRYLWGFFRGLLAPYKLMPGYLLGAIWLIMSVLAVRQVQFPLQQAIMWLSFSTAGLQGGVLGGIGGIVGKGVYAGSLFRIFAKNQKRTEKNWKGKWSFGAALAGLGLSWILFNFFTWDNGFDGSVIGPIAALGLLKAMGNAKGYFSSLVRSFWRERDFRQGWSMGLGMAFGLFLTVPGSLYAGPKTGYLIGLPLFLIGLILGKSKLAQRFHNKANLLFLLVFILLQGQSVYAAGMEEFATVSMFQVVIIGALSSLAAAAATATVFTSATSAQENTSEQDSFSGTYRMVLDKNFGDTICKGHTSQRLTVWVEKWMEDEKWVACPSTEGQLTLYLSTTVPGLRLQLMECKEEDKSVECHVLLDRDWPGEHGVIAMKWEAGNATFHCRTLFHLAGEN